MYENLPFTILILCLVIGLCWFLLESMIWGALSLTVTVSLLAAVADMVDQYSHRATGKRLLIWFLNQNLLLEILGLAMGILVGTTGTLTGLQYAIAADVIATITRWFNKQWARFRDMTLIEDIYKTHMPSDWQPGESLSQVFGLNRLSNNFILRHIFRHEE